MSGYTSGNTSGYTNASTPPAAPVDQTTATDLPTLLAAGAIPMPHAGQIAESLGLDPSTAVSVRCEAPGCGVLVPLGQAFSMAVVYRMPGPGAPGPYQCAAQQHFGCSHACARAAVLLCLDTHIEGGPHA